MDTFWLEEKKKRKKEKNHTHWPLTEPGRQFPAARLTVVLEVTDSEFRGASVLLCAYNLQDDSTVAPSLRPFNESAWDFGISISLWQSTQNKPSIE